MKFLILILALSFIACGGSPVATPTNSVPSAFTNGTGSNLYVYGDSISYGALVPTGTVHPTYPELIAMANNYNLIQDSIGATALFYANQYSLLMISNWQATDTIIYTPGVNDAILFYTEASYLQAYTQGITDILNRFKASGSKVYFGTPTHNCNETRFIPNTTIDVYANINRTALQNVNAPNITLVDYNAGWTPTASNTVDCIHPNTQGYAEMYQYFLTGVAQ